MGLENEGKKGGKMSQGSVGGGSAGAYDVRDDIYDAEDNLQQQQQQHKEEEEEEEERELHAAAQRLEQLLNPTPPPSTTPPPTFPPFSVANPHPQRSLPLPPGSAGAIVAALQVQREYVSLLCLLLICYQHGSFCRLSHVASASACHHAGFTSRTGCDIG